MNNSYQQLPQRNAIIGQQQQCRQNNQKSHHYSVPSSGDEEFRRWNNKPVDNHQVLYNFASTVTKHESLNALASEDLENSYGNEVFIDLGYRLMSDGRTTLVNKVKRKMPSSDMSMAKVPRTDMSPATIEDMLDNIEVGFPDESGSTCKTDFDSSEENNLSSRTSIASSSMGTDDSPPPCIDVSDRKKLVGIESKVDNGKSDDLKTMGQEKNTRRKKQVAKAVSKYRNRRKDDLKSLRMNEMMLQKKLNALREEAYIERKRKEIEDNALWEKKTQLELTKRNQAQAENSSLRRQVQYQMIFYQTLPKSFSSTTEMGFFP